MTGHDAPQVSESSATERRVSQSKLRAQRGPARPVCPAGVCACVRVCAMRHPWLARGKDTTSIGNVQLGRRQNEAQAALGRRGRRATPVEARTHRL